MYTVSKLNGYFEYSSTASADNYVLNIFEQGKHVSDNLKFYNLDLTTNEYVEVKSFYRDKDNNTHEVTDYDIDENIASHLKSAISGYNKVRNEKGNRHRGNCSCDGKAEAFD